MHNYNQRCRDHDYRSECFYMITMTAAAGTPAFSQILTGYGEAYTRLMPLGKRIDMCLHHFKDFHPNLCRMEYVVMPDHIHFLLYVCAPIPEHLGHYIGAFMRRCTQEYNAFRNDGQSLSLFPNGYNDRIVWRSGQKQAIKDYICDNPRRYLIKKSHPDLFHRYLHLEINGREYAAFGNIFLLRDFDRITVRAHRNWTDADYEAHKNPWMKCAENGGVLVSPFIHPYEKRARKEGTPLGANIIEITKDGMPERFSPQGQKFRLCAEGRLLILAPWPDNRQSEQVYRQDCLSMNDMALEVCKPGLRLTLCGDSFI